MTLGEKLKQARLEAGLSQRQLCGAEVTRNMLSQIENGTAKPSMQTLSYFAARLGRPVSFFLEETAVCSPNQQLMAQVRAAVADSRGKDAAVLLAGYRHPDPVFDAEAQLLSRLAVLLQAENALEKGQTLYAAALLDEAGDFEGGYCAPELQRRRLLLLGRAAPRRRKEVCDALPGLDEELLLRARAALDVGEEARCAALLESAQNREDPQWNFLRGELYLAAGQYAEAAAHYHRAEDAYAQTCAPRLERCYKELGDFRMAYEYACRQRQAGG